VDAVNDLGVDPRAADAFDDLDLREPPLPPGPWVRLVFPHREWDRMSGLYRRDLRSALGAGQTWEVEVLSGAAGEVVTLDLTELAGLPPGLVASVLDREQGTIADPVWSRGTRAPTELVEAANLLARYRLVSFGPERPYQLAVLVGDPDYVRRAGQDALVVPSRLTLDRNSPNPFRAATRIRFGLPRASAVRAEIFDVLGQRIATLVEGARLGPGPHALVWDGRTSRGSLAPSGVYLLRVTADGESASRRIVMVR
jgi:hypothetical protein